MSKEIIQKAFGQDWIVTPAGLSTPLPPHQIRAAASAMLEHGLRFVTIVCRQAPAGAFRVSWHWDLRGTLYSIDSILPAGEPLPTIADMYPGADWAERETRDYYAVVFAGRPATEPLMLSENDTPGIMLPTGERL